MSPTPPPPLRLMATVMVTDPLNKNGKKRAPQRAGEKEPFGSSFYASPHPTPGTVLCKLGQPGVLFVFPEVLTPLLGPSLDRKSVV